MNKKSQQAKAKPAKQVGGRQIVTSNRKARHDYLIEDTYEAGIVLLGTEVKALRAGRASLTDGFVQLTNNELWLEGVHIPGYSHGTWTNHAPRRRRKLLLHRMQITKLEQRIKEKGYTIVPLALYFIGSHAKVEIGLGKGKREYDKRQSLRERQDRRETDRAMSQRKYV